MPVVTTMTIIALLGREGSDNQPFFDPDQLRERLAEGLEDQSDAVRADAMALADELEVLVTQYRSRVERTVDAYIEASGDRAADASQLGKRLAAIDDERGELLRDIIRIRRDLVGRLTEAQWQAVFD